MKTLSTSQQASYEAQVTTISTFLKVVRRDDETFGFTTNNTNITIDGVVYEAGCDISNLASSDALNVDNMEVTIIPDLPGGTVTAIDLQTGLWNEAFFEIFEADWSLTTPEPVIQKRGSFGSVQVKNGAYVVEFRSLSQNLQQSLGIATTPTCRARLGDSACKVNIALYTDGGTVTTATSAQVVTDNNITEADDWYAEGIFTPTSGSNVGYTRKIKSYVAGVFTFSLPFPYPFEVGDAYEATAGCRKRHARDALRPDGVSDCVDKFNNILNFQGEPHLAGIDALTRPGSSPDQPATEPDE